ncbi:HNH endonuclease, partial [Mediterraneibacter glycyrrhizinilyticus]|uniref:HNH endonuclease n=1 Tax=Mediterraneibacter glycyrrhizinilyticus TaxID=342942 RepID=UPI0025A3DEEA
MEDELALIPVGEYRDAKLKQRVGQYFFRMTVLNAYSNKCCVTGLEDSRLLIASHIKPWSESNEKTERTNPKNGLCLNALHDKAFDRGLITLNYNYEIIISSQLKNESMDEYTRAWFMNYDHKKIIMPSKFLPDHRFIEYHNDVIFQR